MSKFIIYNFISFVFGGDKEICRYFQGVGRDGKLKRVIHFFLGIFMGSFFFFFFFVFLWGGVIIFDGSF